MQEVLDRVRQSFCRAFQRQDAAIMATSANIAEIDCRCAGTEMLVDPHLVTQLRVIEFDRLIMGTDRDSSDPIWGAPVDADFSLES